MTGPAAGNGHIGALNGGFEGLGLVAEQFGREVGGLATVVVTSEPSDNGLVLRAAWPSRPAGEATAAQLDGFLRSVISDDVSALLPAWSPERPPMVRYALAGPIPAEEGGARGAVCAGLERQPSDPDQALAAACGFGRLAGAGLDNAHEILRLRHIARHDGLTECLNRDALRDVLVAEIDRSQRLRHVLSCCFLDLDDFKAVNDRRGHLAGDRLLADVGAALRANVRPYDHVSRPGGDEFVVVMPETDRDTALDVAGRLRRAVAGAGAGQGLSIKACTGVAAWHPGLTSDDLLDAADREARMAKIGRLGNARARTERRW